jgi:hypothetical protein
MTVRQQTFGGTPLKVLYSVPNGFFDTIEQGFNDNTNYSVRRVRHSFVAILA